MRAIVIDPDRTAADDVVRNLVFAADGQRLGGVLGPWKSEVVRAWRYDLIRDETLPNPDDENYEVEREPRRPDPAWGGDLELLADFLLDDTGHPGLRLTDLWAVPRETAWLRLLELEPTAFTFSSDGESLYAACPPGPIVRWGVEEALAAGDELEPSELAQGTALAITAMATAAGVPWLACGLAVGAVQLFDPSGERSPRRLAAPSRVEGKRVSRVQFSPRGDQVLALAARSLAVWDIESGRQTATPFGGNAADIHAATFTPDGGILTASANGDVVFLDPVTYAETRRLDFGVGPLWGVAVAADGLTAAVGAAHGQAVIFDLE